LGDKFNLTAPHRKGFNEFANLKHGIWIVKIGLLISAAVHGVFFAWIGNQLNSARVMKRFSTVEVDLGPRIETARVRVNKNAAPNRPKRVSVASSVSPGDESGGDQDGHTKSRRDETNFSFYQPEPVYPAEALEEEVEGDVLVRIVTDDLGFVEGLHIVRSSGHRILDQAALQTLKSWRLAAKMTALIPISFHLHQ
jgi:TonB family protein